MPSRTVRRHSAGRLTIESLEDRTVPAATSYLNVALISDAVAQAEQVQAAAAKGVVAVTYDARSATLESLAGILQGISAEHGGARISHLGLVAHGSPGSIHLGSLDTLNAADVVSTSPTWDEFHALLSPNARIDLYACDVAAGRDGKTFVDALARQTGASVYASTNAVGNVKGADLVWEYHAGIRGAAPLFRPAALNNIAGLKLEDAYAPNQVKADADRPTGTNSPNLGVLTSQKTISSLQLVAGAPDWFRFDTAGVGTTADYVRIEFLDVNGNLDLYVYEQDGVTLVNYSESNGDFEEVSLAGKPSGTYYIAVYGRDESVGNPNYTLQVIPPPAALDDPYEINDAKADADRATGLYSPNLGQVAGSAVLKNLVSDGNSDWFRFETTLASTTANYVRLDFANTDGNLDLYVYEQDGVTLVNYSESNGDFEEVSLAGESAGTYYVQVYPRENTLGGNHDYNLQVLAPGSSLSIESPEVSEGDTGQVDAVFTLTRSDSTGTASVVYTTADGSATAGQDYVATSGTVTFNSGELTKTVTVKVLGDVIDEADETFLLKLSSPVGLLLHETQVTGTIVDDDTADVIVAPNGGDTSVAEGGVTDTYSIRLATQPIADVTIALTAGSQLIASPPTLTFTSANWFQAQTVTVSAIDDVVAEGTHSGLVTHLASSADPRYNGIPIADVPVTITDNDSAGVLLIETGGNTVVSEAGTDDTYSIVLLSKPTANVIVQLNASVQLNVSPSLFTFAPADWNVPQPVTVQAVDDLDDEGVHFATISHSVISADGNYDQIAVNNITATIFDNDTKPALLVVPSGGTTNVTEGGTGDSLSVTLATQPTADVTVSVSPDSQLMTSTPTVTFTPGNWNVPQTITVDAIDDGVAEGTQGAILTLSAASADASYNGLPDIDVPVTVADNDRAAVVIEQSGGNTQVAEGGVGDSYSIALNSQPIADVTVTVLFGNQLNVSPSTLTFTTGNWNLPQVVNVDAVDDVTDQGTRIVPIAHAVASTDPNYNNLQVIGVDVIVSDNDSAPSAQFDVFGIDENGSAVPLAVLANDTGSGLSITAVTQGAFGQVVITGGGTGLTYEPFDNFNGTDQFTYTITDVNGATSTAGVLVNVLPVNDPPQLTLPARKPSSPTRLL